MQTELKEKNYYQGCFNGGKSKNFLEMSICLADLIEKDLEQKIISIWHDETALNWYLLEKNPKILDPTFAYPDSRDIGGDVDGHRDLLKIFGSPKILQLNKDDFG
jgi:hypothetical protein